VGHSTELKKKTSIDDTYRTRKKVARGTKRGKRLMVSGNIAVNVPSARKMILQRLLYKTVPYPVRRGRLRI